MNSDLVVTLGEASPNKVFHTRAQFLPHGGITVIYVTLLEAGGHVTQLIDQLHHVNEKESSYSAPSKNQVRHHLALKNKKQNHICSQVSNLLKVLFFPPQKCDAAPLKLQPSYD